MGLKIETWSIAYRKKSDKTLLDDTSEFRIIKNGHKGWYADPFLFDYKGKTYLFAEFYSYKLCRGIIVYSEYSEIEKRFMKYHPIIIEDYHLSYPNIFVQNDKIYMIPEAHESDSLYFYEAVEFPTQWKKSKIILKDIKLVDTTLFKTGNSIKAVSMRIEKQNSEKDGNMLLLDFDGDDFNVTGYRVITNDLSLSRPGGKVINNNGDIVFVTQDCQEEYGKALNFLKIQNLDSKQPIIEVIKKVHAEQIAVKNCSQASGIHTYNVSEDFEVIDLKYYRRSYYRVILKILRKIFKH